MANKYGNAYEETLPQEQLRIGIFQCGGCDEEWNDWNCQCNSSNRQECCNYGCCTEVYPDQLLRIVGNEVPSPEPLIERRIGKFQCSSCSRKWTSRKCRRNGPNRQKCYGCRAKVYPNQLLLTPYQGPYRCYGLYECGEHDPPHEWSSAYSRANKFQGCIICNVRVYPHIQLRNANEDPPPLAQLRIGIFLCDECDEEWNDPNCQGNSSNRQECCNEDCRADVYPDQLLRKVGNKVPSPQHLIERRIGKFQCSSCQLEWKSSECQRNDPNRQKCRRKGCRAKVYPDQLLLTPYQGTRRGYGLYECREHDPPHKWSSAYSWANAFQECERCNDIVYPHEQRPLIGSSNRGDPNHNVRLCGKCQELGHPCNKGRQQQQQQQQNQPRRR